MRKPINSEVRKMKKKGRTKVKRKKEEWRLGVNCQGVNCIITHVAGSLPYGGEGCLDLCISFPPLLSALNVFQRPSLAPRGFKVTAGDFKDWRCS